MKIGVNVTLSSGLQTGNWEHEVRLGAFYSNREPLISYNQYSETNGDYRSIIYCNVVNEMSLDGAYILRRRSQKRQWFSLYTGLGVTAWTTINNQVGRHEA